MMVSKRDYFMEVLLRGKGAISMSYSWLSISPSPEPLSRGLIQRFLNLLAPGDFCTPVLDGVRDMRWSDPVGQSRCGALV